MGEAQGSVKFYESILNETSTCVLPNQNSKYLIKKNRILFQKSEDAFTETAAQMTTLDYFLIGQKVQYVDILKIDVEGNEFAVLRGAQNALSLGLVGLIQIERHADDMRDDDFSEIHEFLRVHGYLIVEEIKHSFGNFFEVLYRNSESKIQ